MFDFGHVPAFLIACAVVIVTPGVDAFLLLRTSLRSGTRAGLLALAGIHSAAAVQVGLVISGLGVVLARYPMVLTALRWIGQMTEAGLFQRVEDDSDRRRAFIALTDRSADAMARYFAEVGAGAAVLA